MKSYFFVATFLLGVAAPSAGNAQYLGPHRQFIALEEFYSRLQLDAGTGRSDVGLDGYGGRLWVNLAPFSGPGDNLIGRTALALFVAQHPRRGDRIGAFEYGTEFDVYVTRTGRFLDPFVILGAEGLRLDNRQRQRSGTADIQRGSRTRFAFTPGGGVRIPIPNRFQIRVDGRDVIVFSRQGRTGTSSRTSHSPEFTASLGLTF